MVDNARRVTHRLYAARAPFEHKGMLKDAGYKWSQDRRAWWMEGDPERIANEEIWLRQLSGAIQPVVDEITWINRHK